MLNQCNFIGRLGNDPEVKFAPTGDAVASFNIGCSESWKDKNGQKQERTEWVKCVAWRKLGEICGEYLKKGALVYVSGKMQTRAWDDKDGNKRYTTEIVLHDMKMLGAKKEGSSPHDEPHDEPPSHDMGDIPF